MTAADDKLKARVAKILYRVTPTPEEAGLTVGAVVKHKDRAQGFGIPRVAGRIKDFIEPQPGWHRALVGWGETERDADDGCDQFVDTDKLKVVEQPTVEDRIAVGDNIGALCQLVKDCGGQMTLFGQPIDASGLRAAAETSVDERLANAVDPGGIRLGQIVHVRAFKKGENRAHIVLAGPSAGRVKLSYCGTERWYISAWYPTEFIITMLQDNAHVRRAKRWRDGIKHSPDGWRRIGCGPTYNQTIETADHIDHPPP